MKRNLQFGLLVFGFLIFSIFYFYKSLTHKQIHEVLSDWDRKTPWALALITSQYFGWADPEKPILQPGKTGIHTVDIPSTANEQVELLLKREKEDKCKVKLRLWTTKDQHSFDFEEGGWYKLNLTPYLQYDGLFRLQFICSASKDNNEPILPIESFTVTMTSDRKVKFPALLWFWMVGVFIYIVFPFFVIKEGKIFLGNLYLKSDWKSLKRWRNWILLFLLFSSYILFVFSNKGWFERKKFDDSRALGNAALVYDNGFNTEEMYFRSRHRSTFTAYALPLVMLFPQERMRVQKTPSDICERYWREYDRKNRTFGAETQNEIGLLTAIFSILIPIALPALFTYLSLSPIYSLIASILTIFFFGRILSINLTETFTFLIHIETALFFFRHFKKPSVLNLILAISSMGICILNQTTAITLMVPVFLFQIMQIFQADEKKKESKRAFIFWGIVVIIVLSWFLPFLSNGLYEYIDFMEIHSAMKLVHDYPATSLKAIWMCFWDVFGIFIFPILISIFFIIFKKGKNYGDIFSLFWVLGCCSVFLMPFVFPRFFMYFIIPAAYLLLSSIKSDIFSKIRLFPRTLMLLIFLMIFHIQARGDYMVIPFVKEWKLSPETITLTGVTPSIQSGALNNEMEQLKQVLQEKQISIIEQGLPIRLEIAPVQFPSIAASYKNQIEQQGYFLKVARDGIIIQSRSAGGIFYGIQTLSQMIDTSNYVPCVEIRDWPDLSVRMIMVDPARQNENFDYYKRFIRFCAHYKINAILLHLTDDQTSCLYHPDYPELMHPHAWREEQIRDLIAYAQYYHIELIPEIESFGHSRMFVRRPDFREILHQTAEKKSKQDWYGTDISGYTNVLCPASEKTYEYLDKMYTQSAKTFTSQYLHIGCDEVDMTRCERCEKKFPGISQSDWFLKHLLRCRELIAKQRRKTALWSDMLLSHPEILKGLPSENTIIYDWHYQPDVSAESNAFFKKQGFEVIGCPSLVCSPHMILPDKHNYINIQRFAEIARQNDLMGLNTTIWIPTRYMSDALWLGIAYACVHSWSGSKWDAIAFYSTFLNDFFGSCEGLAFAQVWNELSEIVWHCAEFNTSCWIDEKSLLEAREMAESKGNEVNATLKKLQEIRDKLTKIGRGVRKNQSAWNTIERSVVILSYTLEHLLTAKNVRISDKWNDSLIREIDRTCLQAIQWIEEDWDRNRYPDDPNKKGIYLPEQHLLHRFNQMHNYHQQILTEGVEKLR